MGESWSHGFEYGYRWPNKFVKTFWPNLKCITLYTSNWPERFFEARDNVNKSRKSTDRVGTITLQVAYFGNVLSLDKMETGLTLVWIILN